MLLAGAALFFFLVIMGVLIAKQRAHKKMKAKIDAVRGLGDSKNKTKQYKRRRRKKERIKP
jgi:hypothetical protein